MTRRVGYRWADGILLGETVTFPIHEFTALPPHGCGAFLLELSSHSALDLPGCLVAPHSASKLGALLY